MFHSIDYLKMGKLSLKVKMGSDKQYIGIALMTQNKLMYIGLITTSSDIYNSFLAMGINCVLVSPNTWINSEFDIASSVLMQIGEGYPYANIIAFQFGASETPDGPLNFWIDEMTQKATRGTIGDTIEIIGMEGNIARFHGVKCIIYSDAMYQLRVASFQRFVQVCYSSGLRLAMKDYQLNISEYFSDVVRRLFLSLFASYIIPAQSILQQSMNTIFNILDPDGHVDIYGDFDNPYKMITDIYWSSPEFTLDLIDVLLIFVERYRPVPAVSEINIIHEQNTIEYPNNNEEATIDITDNPTWINTTTIIGFTTYLGKGSTNTFNLPLDYP